ncbi:MAG: polysulfide reductase NrfD [Chromatiaceae bacterium]|jgi:formate-dependent nitrite reductase membrane component NrfD|nr:polysulfide reductase NrfD [Chromatiaceae bacterium]
MIEEVLVTARYNPKVDPSLGIWTWEIAFYLFLGGMAAGIMLFAAWAVLGRRENALAFAHNRFALWAPVVLSLGMTTLFLDLEYKLHVFRFYTSFEPSSPMSWGAWVLVLIYPLMLVQTLSTLRTGYPTLAGLVERIPGGAVILSLCEHRRRLIAWLVIPLAVGLGIYTGVLLSAFSARPFWNSGILGPLFLVSGMSTAAVLPILAGAHPQERHFFEITDMALIAVELVLIALFLINLATGAAQHMDALALVTGGPYTAPFWLWFVLPGLLVPIVFELAGLRGYRGLGLVAGVLVVYGGFMLRYLMVDIGQASTWTDYALQFDPQLLQRLMQ